MRSRSSRDFPTTRPTSRGAGGRAKSASIDPSKITKTGPATTQQAPNNWLMSLLHKIPPFSIIGQVSDAYGNATGTN
jgi:hypothetical protein